VIYNAQKEQERFESARREVTKDDGQVLYAGSLLHYAAKKYGERIALIYQNEQISFMRLYMHASAFAHELKKHGVTRADRVLICIENSPAFYVAYFATWQLGAVVVPVNTFLKEHELAHIIADATPRVICTSHDRAELFKASPVPVLTDLSIQSTEFGLTQNSGERAAQNTAVLLEAPVTQDPEALCALLYTSGTTGVPKGVMLSSRAIVANMLQVEARLYDVIGEGQRIFAVLPLFHVFAQNTAVWTPMLTGCTVILVHKIDRRLIMDNLRHKPTFFLGVPALYGMLCLLKTAPLDSVDYFISGGDGLPDKIRGAFALIYRRKICSGYGLTETAPVIAVDLSVDTGFTSNVGRPLVGVRCSVRDEQGREVAQGNPGELWVAGPNIMSGYYHEQAMTDQVMVQEGENLFFKTGDTVYVDNEGNIIITGRIKDLIINKGFNVYPPEIENVILSHPNVIGVGVVGQQDAEVGEVPVAFVQVRAPQPGIEQELRELCLSRLASYKVPKTFICSPESLPVTATGKVDKKILRARIKA
jgi:long-chain acyl-CoA synthetase